MYQRWYLKSLLIINRHLDYHRIEMAKKKIEDVNLIPVVIDWVKYFVKHPSEACVLHAAWKKPTKTKAEKAKDKSKD